MAIYGAAVYPKLCKRILSSKHAAAAWEPDMQHSTQPRACAPQHSAIAAATEICSCIRSAQLAEAAYLYATELCSCIRSAQLAESAYLYATELCSCIALPSLQSLLTCMHACMLACKCRGPRLTSHSLLQDEGVVLVGNVDLSHHWAVHVAPEAALVALQPLCKLADAPEVVPPLLQLHDALVPDIGHAVQLACAHSIA